MRNYFVFDGKSSLDFGLYITADPNVYNIPDRNYQTYSVPGGNGDIITNNVNSHAANQVTYKGFISYEAYPKVKDLLAFLASKAWFCRLEDTYNPDEYRMAIFITKPEIQYDPYNKVFSVAMTFTTKPQRWLKSGEFDVLISKEGTKLRNPTYFEAWPLLKLRGSGTLTINDTSITVIDNDDGVIFINTGSQNAYDEHDQNASNKVIQVIYPPLNPGDNKISYSGFRRVDIQPRWETR